MPEPISLIRPTDDEARALARGLLADARHATLGTLEPATGAPFVSRIALGLTPSGEPLTLISTLAQHTRALAADPRASLLVGEPGSKGDPLTHPRLTVQARARFVGRQDAEHAALRAHYLATHPKATLYIDFADFAFVVFSVEGASLNGGFGKAYSLTAADLSSR
ncbi:MAG: HugZ family protein [Paracoccaceae bacterium]|nr:HugZ family protein [Paracoccaceae bacterium]